MARPVRRANYCAVILVVVIGLASCGGGTNTPPPPPPAPHVSLSTTSLVFSGQVVGTTSPGQTVTLTNSGTSSLSISNVAASGDFAVTQTCGVSLAASANCTVSVTFSPSSGGQQTQFLTITDNASDSPQSVTLNGTGMGGLVKLSTDNFANLDSQHATEVEPDTFASASTIVSVFQMGRFLDGGASDIGFSTSLDGGATWAPGVLPGITRNENIANPYDRASDPVIAYDAKHAVWIAESLPITVSGTSVNAPDVVINRSPDGINWGGPITVNSAPGNLDKPWIACDNWPTSPFYGNCYVEWDANAGFSNNIQMSTSSDGGLTWGAALPTTPVAAHGLGGQPLAQPNGNVVVPIGDANLNNILAFTSSNGGASWNSAVLVSAISNHLVAGNLRTDSLPSADVDAAGNIYVVWQDCRFRAGCPSNDIIMSISPDGTTWPVTPTRIPIDATTSTVDHFIPGIAVEPGTSGATAHLALTYYYYPVANCTAATCELNVGFISSQDGGVTWSTPVQLAGPMELSSLPNTSQGVMVGDYISTSFVNGLAFEAFAVANPVNGTIFDEAIYSTATGLSANRTAARRRSAGERPVANVRSDREVRKIPAKFR